MGILPEIVEIIIIAIVTAFVNQSRIFQPTRMGQEWFRDAWVIYTWCSKPTNKIKQMAHSHQKWMGSHPFPIKGLRHWVYHIVEFWAAYEKVDF